MTGRVVGDAVAVKPTVPEKPLMLIMMSVDVAEAPAVMVMLLGIADITKSGVALVENTAA